MVTCRISFIVSGPVGEFVGEYGRKVFSLVLQPSHKFMMEQGFSAADLLAGSGITEEQLASPYQVLDSDQVAAACDPKHLFLKLIPPFQMTMEFERNVQHYRTRGSTAKVNLALDRYPELPGRPDLQAVFLRTGTTLDDLERAFDPVKYRDFALEPMLDIYVPTLEAPDLAPTGHHVFSIQAHWIPYDLEEGWSEAARDRLFECVLDTLEGYLPEIRQAVVGTQVLSPVDLERTYGVTGGHLLHGEHATDQLILRPTPECARYETPYRGLFLCGSGSHPGGGITCAPGALATQAILA